MMLFCLGVWQWQWWYLTLMIMALLRLGCFERIKQWPAQLRLYTVRGQRDNGNACTFGRDSIDVGA